MTATGKLREALERHDLRRWIRFIKADNSFDYLRCYCGEKISEDSEEAMFTHVAEAALAESVAEQAASGAQREPDPPGVHEHDDHTGLCPECVDAGRKLAAPAAPELSGDEVYRAVFLLNPKATQLTYVEQAEIIADKLNALLRASQAGSKAASKERT